MFRNFFTELSIQVKSGKVNPELTNWGGKKLVLRPKPSLGFPARDIDEIVETSQSMSIICQFLGLYGVDSPLPNYLNEQCLQESKGAALRHLLDALGHRHYALYYQAWQAFQPLLSKSEDHQNLLSALSGQYPTLSKHLTPSYSHQHTLCSMKRNIETYFRDHSVIIDTVAHWVELTRSDAVGVGCALGENSNLGDKLFVQAQVIIITLELFDCTILESLSEYGRFREQVVRQIQIALPIQQPFRLNIKINPKQAVLNLGNQYGFLGISSVLG